MALKRIFYWIFAGFFKLYSVLPLQCNKVFLIMTHDPSENGNIFYVHQSLKKRITDMHGVFIIKNSYRLHWSVQGLWRILDFYCIKPYHLARAQYVFLDNTFLPMAYLRFKSSVRIVQLWHGCGAVKRFGQDVNTGRFAELERRANQAYTHLIVSGRRIVKDYASAFNIPEARIFPVGVPRTDFFFETGTMQACRTSFYIEFPELREKKLLLYAPTFRDQEMDRPRIHFDFDKFFDCFGENWVILLRLHPLVTSIYSKGHMPGSGVRDVSGYKDLNTLLLVSDALVTDYSSIIFEYSLLRKPMYFYAYDYHEFSRGFYFNYHEVPGPIALDMDELLDLLTKNAFDYERLDAFVCRNFDCLDGRAVHRVLDLVMKQSGEVFKYV